jgi:hypothetical protein
MTSQLAAWLTFIGSLAEVSACVGWLLLFSPKSDKLRLEDFYWAPGREIVRVKRLGTAPGGRGGAWYRVYEVVVKDFNRVGRYRTGVQVTISAQPRLKQFSRPHWRDATD